MLGLILAELYKTEHQQNPWALFQKSKASSRKRFLKRQIFGKCYQEWKREEWINEIQKDKEEITTGNTKVTSEKKSIMNDSALLKLKTKMN